MKVLCVAEKPSVAKEISRILSNGRLSSVDKKKKKMTAAYSCFEITIDASRHFSRLRNVYSLVIQRRGHNKYQTVLDFECNIPQFGNCQVFGVAFVVY